MDRREALKRMGLLTAGVAVGAYGTVLWKGRKSKGAGQELTEEEGENLRFTCEWTRLFLTGLQAQREGSADGMVNMKKVMKGCSVVCFEKNDFREKIAKCGNFDNFLTFCEQELGWIVNFDREAKVIVCNENKDECLCPIVKACKGAVEGSLCLCTEGELTRMFEKAYGGKVKAEVISSILRGQERCIYRISLL